MDEALVPHAHRLRIRRRNFRLLSDISSKESTLQLVYDVLRLTPFFKAFLVTVDVPEIYMHEFWATATVHHHSIRFKIDNKKHIVNLESFREMLHICPRLPGQPFVEPPFEKEIMAFLRFLGHNGAIRRFTDVNINKLHQPWRSFAAIINKCLTWKSSGYDSLRLSQAQILWGLYHKRNVDFAYLMWEDFVYQVEHKDTNKSNEMYYLRFTKVIIHHIMAKDPSVLRRNKVNWHYVRDDHMFTTIKLEYYEVSTGATPPKTKASVRKTKSSSDTTVTPPPTAAAGLRVSTSVKGKQPAKASKAKSLTALSEVAMTEAKQLKLAIKRSLQQTHISQASGYDANEGIGTIPGVLDVPTDESDEEIHLSTHDEEETKDEESFDPIPKTPENTDDECNGKENLGTNVGREEGNDEEDEEDELYRDVNINLGRGVQMADVHTTQEFEDSHVTLTPATSHVDVQTPTSVAPLLVSAPTLTLSTIATVTTIQQAPTPPTIAPSTLLQDLPNFSLLFGFDHRLKTLEANFSKFMQTNQFAGAVSSIPRIVQRYMDQRMNEPVKVAVQIQSDRLRNEAQAENDEFLKTIDENMQKIIKEQVKEQVKVQVFKILPKIEHTVNKKLEAEVLTRSSNSSKTSYTIAVDLFEMELKKILIEKIEGNKSIHRSNEQRNLYKALVEVYESDKIILDTYGETVTLKRRRDNDADKDKEPFAGSDQGSKRRREGKEPDESATAEEPMQTTHEMEEPSHPEFKTGPDDQPIVEPSQHLEWFSQQKKPPTPDRDWNKTLSATHESIQPWINKLAKQSDSRSSFNELMDTPVDFFTFLMNRLKVDTLTPELLDGLTYELMNGSCKSLVELELFLEEVYKATTDQLDWVNPKGQQYLHNRLKPLPLIPNSRGHHVIPFDHFINNNLEYLRGGALSRKYTTSVTKTKAADYEHIKWIEDLVPRTMWIQEPVGYDKHALWGISHWGRKRQQFYDFAVNRESARDVYSKRRIIAVTELKIVEWHNYNHLDWITVHRDDDKLYMFKEGDFKRLRIQDIEDMLLLLVQGKLKNLTVEERFAFNVSLRMFTRSIVIQRHVEDLQLGVESYQKKLNLTRPYTYRSDLKRKEAYIAYSNPRGFIYQNKDKHNRLMRIDELHKFSDGTLTDVRTALDDCLKGIRMKYLPQSI
nr:hypothetical protein [Tanacetum cinerariifolium]